MKILAIESSCDETAAAVVEDGRQVIQNIVASSHDMHEKYGGIVPEVAARLQLESIIPVITEALLPLKASPDEPMMETIQKNIDAIAVTEGPGLIGSLLIGVESAKTIAAVTGKPLIPVNHVLAHMYANFVGDSLPAFPAISLVVSGGHTELYHMTSEKNLVWLGGTLDDAAGECFDKTARLLGFGHGGGVAIQQAASTCISSQRLGIHLPRPMLDKKNRLNFSFSGLKTAILREVTARKESGAFDESVVSELSYEVQETITDVLVKKTLRAADDLGVRSILLSGGVSANTRLREKLKEQAQDYDIFIPPIELCTDNAVYIASYAFFKGTPKKWGDVMAIPDLSVEVGI